MSDGNWRPWKMFAIGMGLVAVTAVVTAAVVADWSGRPPNHPAATNASSSPRSRAAPVPPAVPTPAAIDACNQYAAAPGGEAGKTAETGEGAAPGAPRG